MKTRALLFSLTSTAAIVWSASAWAAGGAVLGDHVSALSQADELIATGKYKEAAALCDRASQLASGPCPECLLGVARAYAGAGQLTAAIQTTRMAIPFLATSPNDQARAYVQLGALLVRNGASAAESDEAFQRAVALDGGVADAVRAQLAEALLARTRQEEARRQPAAPTEVVVANPTGGQ